MALFTAGMTCVLCCRIPQRHLAFSFVQHNDGFLHILRVRAIRCGSKCCARHSLSLVAGYHSGRMLYVVNSDQPRMVPSSAQVSNI